MKKPSDAQLDLIRDLRMEIHELDQGRRKFYALPGTGHGALAEIERLKNIKRHLEGET